jgi:hypothetical protein
MRMKQGRRFFILPLQPILRAPLASSVARMSEATSGVDPGQASRIRLAQCGLLAASGYAVVRLFRAALPERVQHAGGLADRFLQVDRLALAELNLSGPSGRQDGCHAAA